MRRGVYVLIVVSLACGCAVGDPGTTRRDAGRADTADDDALAADTEPASDTGALDSGALDSGVPDSGTDTSADAEVDTGAADSDAEDAGEPDADAPPPPPSRLTCDAPAEVSPARPLVAYDFTRDADDIAARAPEVNLVADGSAIVSGGSALFFGGRMVATSAATDSLAGALAGGSFTIELFARADDLTIEEPFPPERLFTISLTARTRALTIGVDEDALVIRLKTSLTEENATDCLDGAGGRLGAQMILPGVFTASGPSKHIAVVFDAGSGRPSVFVDGLLRETTYCPGRATLDWEAGYQLALGNELADDRAFDGRIDRVAVYDRALSAAEIACWNEAGPDAPIEL